MKVDMPLNKINHVLVKMTDNRKSASNYLYNIRTYNYIILFSPYVAFIRMLKVWQSSTWNV